VTITYIHDIATHKGRKRIAIARVHFHRQRDGAMEGKQQQARHWPMSVFESRKRRPNFGKLGKELLHLCASTSQDIRHAFFTISN
jgi:hypothetical protein